jgi:hypothetical protein
MPPRIPRATSASVRIRPNALSNTGPRVRSPSARYVAGFCTTRPPFFRPMNAMNSPMPTAMANFSDMGMAFSTASRRFVSTRIVTRMPSTITTAIACCQLKPIPRIKVNATMAFRPRPEARASGKFAKTPIAMLVAAAATHVAKNTADTESPVPSVPRIAGLTKIM